MNSYRQAQTSIPLEGDSTHIRFKFVNNAAVQVTDVEHQPALTWGIVTNAYRDIDGVAWFSVSQILQYRRCPRRWRDGEPTPPNDAMLEGSISHAKIAAILGSPVLEVEVGDPAIDMRGQKAVDRFLTAYRLPPADRILSVEAANLPEQFMATVHGRSGFGVRLGVVATASGDIRIGMRGAMDLVSISADGTTLEIRDWKRRNLDEDDNKIAAAGYVVPAAIIWPGFSSYTFRAVSIADCRDGTIFEFAASEIRAATDWLCGICATMLADLECLPKLNKYCGDCNLRADCPEYTKATTTVPSGVRWRDFSEAAAYCEQLKIIATSVDAERDRVRGYIEATIRATGPQSVGQYEYSGKDVPTSFAWDLHRLVAVIARLGLNPETYLRANSGAISNLADQQPGLRDELMDCRLSPTATSFRVSKRLVAIQAAEHRAELPEAMVAMDSGPLQPADPSELPFAVALEAGDASGEATETELPARQQRMLPADWSHPATCQYPHKDGEERTDHQDRIRAPRGYVSGFHGGPWWLKSELKNTTIPGRKRTKEKRSARRTRRPSAPSSQTPSDGETPASQAQPIERDGSIS